jgi:hypothetical protein
MEQHTKQLSEHLKRRNQIDRLRLHLMQNILYYMQSIWTYESAGSSLFFTCGAQARWRTDLRNYLRSPGAELRTARSTMAAECKSGPRKHKRSTIEIFAPTRECSAL